MKKEKKEKITKEEKRFYEKIHKQVKDYNNGEGEKPNDDDFQRYQIIAGKRNHNFMIELDEEGFFDSILRKDK